MLVPFGTRVVDVSGKGVGTVSRLVLHPKSREVADLVVHQGVVNRREVVVPLSQVAGVGAEVRLRLRAPELEGAEIDEASRRITRVTVRRGVLFGTETAIPASMIASVATDRITLRVAA